MFPTGLLDLKNSSFRNLSFIVTAEFNNMLDEKRWNFLAIIKQKKSRNFSQIQSDSLKPDIDDYINKR